MTFKHLFLTLSIVICLSTLSFSQDESDKKEQLSSLIIPQAGVLLLNQDPVLQGTNSRIFYGLGFKTSMKKSNLGYFVFDARYSPNSTLTGNGSLFSLNTGIGSEIPIIKSISSTLGFSIGVTNLSVNLAAGGLENNISFAWEGKVGFIHHLTESLALEANASYLKSASSPISGVVLQTGLIQKIGKKMKNTVSDNSIEEFDF